jgi:hypothetical protein
MREIAAFDGFDRQTLEKTHFPEGDYVPTGRYADDSNGVRVFRCETEIVLFP